MSKDDGRTRPCPICETPAKKPFEPFCSARCKQIDLNRWLSSGYAIPGNPSEDDSDGVPQGESAQNIDDASENTPTRH